VITAVCVSVCLSVPLITAKLLHGYPDVSCGNGRGCPLVVHYSADLQAMHGFRCCDNIARTRNVSECFLLALCLVPDWGPVLWVSVSALTLLIVWLSHLAPEVLLQNRWRKKTTMKLA